MKRKVVKQGASTLMVSIPSTWARKFNILKGDEVEVSEEGRSLCISTEKEHKLRKTEINIDDLEPMVMRTLAALYKAGYDEVKITFSDPKQIIDVQKALANEISNFEIIEQTKKFCVIKNVVGSLEEGFDPILRRTFILLLTMADESFDAIKNNDYSDLLRLRMLEETNNRLTTLCRRYLSKRGYEEHNKIQFIYHLIEQLERIADQFKYLFDYLLNAKQPKLSSDTIEYYLDMKILLRDFYELFYQFDIKKVAKIGKLRKKLISKISAQLNKKNHLDITVGHYLIIISQLTFELVEPYLAMKL